MDFLPIRIGTLRPGGAVRFHVHVKVAEKYIHYIQAEEVFEQERIARLKSKGVKKVFIRIEEEPLYLAYLDEGLDTLGQATAEISERGSLANDSLVSEVENIDRALETEAGYLASEGRVAKIIDFLGSDKGALKSILESAGAEQDFSQHGANVASLSLGLALKIGTCAPRELSDLAMASLVHDLGCVKLGISPWALPTEMDPQALSLFKKHPQATMDGLAGKRFITPGILRLVLDHEEIGDGRGYPERKRLSSLPLTSQIMNLCNEFDRMAMAKKLSPTALMPIFFQEKADLFDLDHLTKLGEVIAGK